MIKHILFTKNPGWENVNPFVFEDNNDFLISAHHYNDILAIIQHKSHDHVTWPHNLISIVKVW